MLRVYDELEVMRFNLFCMKFGAFLGNVYETPDIDVSIQAFEVAKDLYKKWKKVEWMPVCNFLEEEDKKISLKEMCIEKDIEESAKGDSDIFVTVRRKEYKSIVSAYMTTDDIMVDRRDKMLRDVERKLDSCVFILNKQVDAPKEVLDEFVDEAFKNLECNISDNLVSEIPNVHAIKINKVSNAKDDDLKSYFSHGFIYDVERFNSRVMAMFNTEVLENERLSKFDLIRGIHVNNIENYVNIDGDGPFIYVIVRNICSDDKAKDSEIIDLNRVNREFLDKCAVEFRENYLKTLNENKDLHEFKQEFKYVDNFPTSSIYKGNGLSILMKAYQRNDSYAIMA